MGFCQIRIGKAANIVQIQGIGLAPPVPFVDLLVPDWLNESRSRWHSNPPSETLGMIKFLMAYKQSDPFNINTHIHFQT